VLCSAQSSAINEVGTAYDNDYHFC